MFLWNPRSSKGGAIRPPVKFNTGRIIATDDRRCDTVYLCDVPKIIPKKPVRATTLPWLKSYEREIEPFPDFPEKPLYALLDEAAAAHGPA
jgi:hypothetical protein